MMLNLISRKRVLTLLVLVVLYGVCVYLLQSLVPELVTVLLAFTLGLIVLAGSLKLWLINRLHWIPYLRQLWWLPRRFYETGVEPVASAPVTKMSTLSVVISAAFCAGLVFVPLLFSVIPLLGILIGLPLIAMAFFASKSNLDPLLLPRRLLVRLRAPAALSATALPRLRWWMVLLEVGVIVITTLLTTRPFYDSPSNWQFSGNEAEWLTSTIAAAHTGLQESGRIPRWQPYLGNGEPITENPFNFIFNPFASAPSLLLGPVAGLRISIIIGYFLAGLGGWFLGRVLGLGTLGRILLAMLLIGKGNLHAMMNSGYYQLALSQIYMPYVIGGVLAVFRWPKQRWPVVLTALALALQFLSGNIWYVLPTAVGAICVGGMLLVGEGKRWVDFIALKRLLLAAAVAVGLSAVVALPVVLQFKQLGRHPDEINGGWSAQLSQIVRLYFDPNPDQTLNIYVPVVGEIAYDYSLRRVDEFYYSYIIPVWYVLLILVALPLYRPVKGREQQIGWVALIFCLLATLWGAGGKQPILLLYQHLPFLAQWRYVGRALAVATFWIAVLLAMRVDNLWRHIFAADWSTLLNVPLQLAKRVPVVLGGVLLVATVVAGADVNDQWYKMDHIIKETDPYANACLSWLRAQYPDQPLVVWQQQYNDITPYLNNRIRTWAIGADFEMLPQNNTLGSPLLDLNKVQPKYARLNLAAEVFWPYKFGYHIMLDSPPALQTNHCLFERDDTLPYAYTVTRSALESMNTIDDVHLSVVNLQAFSPVRLFERRGDQIALIIANKRTEPTVVGVQESAYPGWRVEVNGQAAPLESVGGQIGVILPAGDQPVQVYFVYDPAQPVIGGMITLITALGCVVYLLVGHRRKRIEN